MRHAALLITSSYFLSTCINAQSFPDEIFLKATYRDFLPADCFLVAQDADLNQFLLDAFPTGAKIGDVSDTALSTSSNENGHCNLIFNSANKEVWTTLFKQKKIIAHPDFDTNKVQALGGIGRENGVCGDNSRQFPLGSCVDESDPDGFKASIMQTTLKTGSNGLPLPVYCIEDDDEARCGFNERLLATEQTQTQKKFFDKWYNDDLAYSKRVGQRLKLKKTEEDSTSATYSFQAVSSFGFSEEPDFAGVANNHFGPLDRFKTPGGSREVKLAELTSYQAILDAPAWPQIQDKAGLTTFTFSFTSEIHSTFRFDSSSKMQFTFSGDDDFFTFINGKMVIDLYGVHGEQQLTVDLNTELDNGTLISEVLGLEDGKVYTIDMYHAERQMDGSHFIVTSTLIPACDVTQIGTKSFTFRQEDRTSELNLETRFSFNGVKLNDAGNGFLLQQKDHPLSASFFFTRTKENVATGFVANFLVRIDGNTEGFAFVVHNDEVDDFLPTGATTLGFGDVANSFAIAFALCVDGDTCDLQEVSVHYANETLKNSFSQDTKKTFDRIHRNLKRNEAFPVEIIYYGDNPNFLEVYVNNSLYLRENTFDIESIIGGTGAHVGLTASSSLSSADIEITDWFLEIIVVDPTFTELISTNFSLQSVVADSADVSEGYTISTSDSCGTLLLSGTLDSLVSSVFFELVNESTGEYFDNATSPAIVEGTVIDNDDGTYTVALKTERAGIFGMAMAFGTGCSLQTSFNEVDGVNVSVVSLLKSDSSTECFFQLFEDPVVEATPLPGLEDPNFNGNDDGVDSSIIVALVASGGGIVFCAFLVTPILLKFKHDWYNNKKYIVSGNLYKQELQTTYNVGDAYKQLGMQLVESQREILELQARNKIDYHSEEVAKLTQENATLRESVKQMRNNVEPQANQDPSVQRKVKKSRKKLDF